MEYGNNWVAESIYVKGKKIHYYRTATECPPIILLHGIMDNGLCWTPVAETLSSQYDVLMPDARGHGLTEIGEQDFSYQEMAGDVALLMDELHIPSAHILGHSMGAGTAILAAHEYPDKVKSLLLEDPGIRLKKLSWLTRFLLTMGMRLGFSFLLRGDYDKIYARGEKWNKQWSEAELKPWAFSKVQFKEKDSPITKKFFSYSYDWRDIFREIKCPILLLTSSKGFTKDKTAKELRDLNPKVQWEKIDGAGHNLRREQFESYMEIVSRFLEKNQ